MVQHLNKGRRYSAEEKAAAVRMVRTLRAELGTSQGTTSRVAAHRSSGARQCQFYLSHAASDP